MQSNANPVSPPDSMEETYRRYLAAVVVFHLKAAAASGLGPVDYQASSLLELDGPLTTGALAERLALTSSATTRQVDRLVSAGLARRVQDSGDRRRVVVEHTGHLPAGLQEVLTTVRAPIEGLLGNLSAEQLAGLGQYFAGAGEAYLDAARRIRATPA